MKSFAPTQNYHSAYLSHVSHNKIKIQIKAMIGFLVTQPAVRGAAHYVGGGAAIKQFTIFKLRRGVCVIILVLKEYVRAGSPPTPPPHSASTDSPNCRKKSISLCKRASVQVPLENMIRRNQNSISLTSIAQAVESAAQKAFFGSCGCEFNIAGRVHATGAAAPPHHTFCANLLQIVRDQIQLIDNAKHFAVGGLVVCQR